MAKIRRAARAALVSTLCVSAAACSAETPPAMTPPTIAPAAPATSASGAAAPPMIAGGSAGIGTAGSVGSAGSVSAAGAPAQTGVVPSGTAGSSSGSAAGSTGGTAGSSAAATGGSSTPPTAGVSGSGVMEPMAGAAGTSSTPSTCEKGAVKASEVVFIGESFIAASRAIPRFTSQLARDAGTIGASESYRSYAVSGTLLTSGDIPGQYARAEREGPVKVVLMDGGGNDLLVGRRCQSGFDAGCKEIVTVVQTLFADMKKGGVEDVVYFFYPDPMGIGASIKGAMDILRPEMKKACDAATDVRCVWVDQRESWEGKYGMYTSDGIHPTDAGSMASAKQIWDAMVASCIAQ